MHVDSWAQKAKQAGYRSRAVFKLEEILQTIKKELGWEHDELEGVPDEANPVSSKIECFMQGTRDYIKFIKRGYTRISQNMSVELREGRIS